MNYLSKLITVSAVIGALVFPTVGISLANADEDSSALISKSKIIESCGDGHPGHSPKKAYSLAKAGWDSKKIKKRENKIDAVRHKKICPASKNSGKYVADIISKQKKQYKRAKRQQAEVSALTPYDCGANGNWAIPCEIVACESGFSWSAYNPSGALGPYQLLGWGAPWPVNSEADKLAHHRIAASVWNGGAGRSNWVC